MNQAAEAGPAPLPVGLTTDALEAITRLAPDDLFPEYLVELSLEQLQVLHSRLCRQLELEYLTTAEGGHPITRDRLYELQAEFDSRFRR